MKRRWGCSSGHCRCCAGVAAVTFGMVAYYATETLLFGYALHALGRRPVARGGGGVLALQSSDLSHGHAVGVGITEVGTAATLVAMGTRRR